MKAHIVGASQDFESSKLSVCPQDLLITADGGYDRVADKSRIDVALGDFDSLGYVPEAKKIVKLNVEKNETDSDSAAMYAISLGADEIVFHGCLGGLADHMLANLQLGTRLAKNGIKVAFEGKGYRVLFLHNDKICFCGQPKCRVSVFSPDLSKGVTIKGLKYEVVNITLDNGYALGVSNEFTDKQAEISVKEGVLIIFIYEKTCGI